MFHNLSVNENIIILIFDTYLYLPICSKSDFENCAKAMIKNICQYWDFCKEKIKFEWIFWSNKNRLSRFSTDTDKKVATKLIK